MSTVNVFQISLEIWGCLLCLVIAIILGDKAYKEGSTLNRLWRLLLINGFLLICDAFAYIFRGEPSGFGILMTRGSNMLVFFLEGVITWDIAASVQELIAGEKESVLKAGWMKVCSVLIGIQLLGAVLTPFTGLYFSFDASNHYQREPGVYLSFAMLGAVCAMSAVQLFRNSRLVPVSILHIFRTAIPIFAACFVIQALEYGLSLINVGLTLLLVMLYLGFWKESMNREKERQTEELESLMQELMTDKEEKNR